MTNGSDLLYGQAHKGKSIPSVYRSLPVSLHQAREAFGNCLRPVFLKYDLTDPQWRVLRILSSVDRIDTGALAKRSLLLGPSLSRILRDLLARKLITRTVSEDDARRAFHAITPAGLDLIEMVMPQFDPLYEQISSQLDEEEVTTLNGLLDRLAKVLNAIDLE